MKIVIDTLKKIRVEISKNNTYISNGNRSYLCKTSKLTASTDAYTAYKDTEYVIIATPTDYDPQYSYYNNRPV